MWNGLIALSAMTGSINIFLKQLMRCNLQPPNSRVESSTFKASSKWEYYQSFSKAALPP